MKLYACKHHHVNWLDNRVYNNLHQLLKCNSKLGRKTRVVSSQITVYYKKKKRWCWTLLKVALCSFEVLKRCVDWVMNNGLSFTVRPVYNINLAKDPAYWNSYILMALKLFAMLFLSFFLEYDISRLKCYPKSPLIPPPVTPGGQITYT